MSCVYTGCSAVKTWNEHLIARGDLFLVSDTYVFRHTPWVDIRSWEASSEGADFMIRDEVPHSMWDREDLQIIVFDYKNLIPITAHALGYLGQNIRRLDTDHAQKVVLYLNEIYESHVYQTKQREET